MSSTVGKVINCRAAVLYEEGKPLIIENIAVDVPQSGEVRLRMVSAGICRTDAHFIWDEPTDVKLNANDFPVILGHEGAGIVESVGEGVTRVSVGDKVLPLCIPNCEKCPLCRNPRSNLCVQPFVYSQTRATINGKRVTPVWSATFAEYAVVREIQVTKVNPAVNLDNACILGCAVGTGYGSAVNMAQVYSGSTCAVWGLGAIGLSAVLGCKDSGAQRIIGVDVNPEKEKFAQQFGCTEFVNPLTLGKPIEEYLQELGGIDYAFDCVGNKQIMESAMRSLSPWGTLLLVGLPPRGTKLEISVGDLLTGQSVCGGYFGRYKTKTTNEMLAEKYATGKLAIDSLITHRFKLDEINEALDLFKAGKCVRAVIIY